MHYVERERKGSTGKRNVPSLMLPPKERDAQDYPCTHHKVRSCCTVICWVSWDGSPKVTSWNRCQTQAGQHNTPNKYKECHSCATFQRSHLSLTAELIEKTLAIEHRKNNDFLDHTLLIMSQTHAFIEFIKMNL